MKPVKILYFILIMSVILCGCSNNPSETNGKVQFEDHVIDRNNFKSSVADPGIKNEERFNDKNILSKKDITYSLNYIIKKIDENIYTMTYMFPSPSSTNLKYSLTDNKDWTEGFWTGMLWNAYEYTKDEKYKEAADIQCKSFKKRLEYDHNLEHHDIGFLYFNSCVKGYELTGNNDYKDVALKAADKLLCRYNEKGKFIQSWGEYGQRDESRFIIDNMMNLELLYWASKETKNKKYYNAAYEHAKTNAMVIIRKDASTYHTYYVNPDTGNPSHGVTAQGVSDDSAWSRGQAWGCYGFNISYRYTKDKLFMQEGEKINNYFLNHLPDDLICYWDLSFVSGNEPRDSSAAAILASALLDCSKTYKGKYEKIYFNAANSILKSLTESYTTKNVDSNGILMHGVYSKPGNAGVDECLLWGDYYYMESLMKLYKSI